jgi:hypothetical protein
MDEDAGGVPHPSHMSASGYMTSSNGHLLPVMQGGMGSSMSNLGMGMPGLGIGSGLGGMGSGIVGGMSGIGGGMPMGGSLAGMGGMGMGGISGDMDRRNDDGSDFSNFVDDGKAHELSIDEPQVCVPIYVCFLLRNETSYL